MLRDTGRLVAMGAAALGSAAWAQAGGPQPVQAGRAVEGRLSGAEVRHRLTMRAGETVRIDARSREFDPLLKLYRATRAEPLVSDDDSGGGRDAELVFTAEQAGTYDVGVSISGPASTRSSSPATRAQALDGDAARTGAAKIYDLTVVPAARPPRPTPIDPNGAATSVDMARCRDGCRFTFAAHSNERVVAFTSDGAGSTDPALALYEGADKLADDDDGGGGVNARIVRRINRPATYTIVARTLSGDGTFKLHVTLRPIVVRPPASLSVGTTVSGTITEDSELNDQDKSYDAYTLHGRAGQRLVFELAATDFDPELEVRAVTVVGPTQIALNDDAAADPAGPPAGRDLNSRLALAFVADGDVEIRAISRDKGGAYTLRVVEQPDH